MLSSVRVVQKQQLQEWSAVQLVKSWMVDLFQSMLEGGGRSEKCAAGPSLTVKRVCDATEVSRESV